MNHRIAVVSFSIIVAACPGNNPSDGGTDAADVDESVDTGTDAAVADSGRDADVQGDAGERPIIGSRVPVPAQDGVSPDGAADVESEIAGEARAGRITGETGFAGLWSHCKTGDFRLYNGVVEACISNEQSNRYEMFAGGGLVDVRTVGTTADEVFDLYAPRIGFNTLHAETVEVIRDGSDGGPAVIRAEGTDMPAAYFVGVAGEQAFQPKGLSVSVEYRLAPDGDFFEIATFIRNDQEGPVQTQRGDLLAFGDRAVDFRRASGLDPEGSSEPFNWIAAAGQGHSFAWVAPDEPLDSLSSAFGNPPWELTQTDGLVLEPGEETVHFGRLFVGDGSVDQVVRRVREDLVRPTGEPREISVVDGDGVSVAGRWVEVTDDDGLAVSADRTDANGAVTLHIPDGPHQFRIGGVVGGGEVDESRDVGTDPLEFTVPTAARVRVDTNVDGAPAVASVEAGAFAGTSRDGTVEFQTVPGELTVSVSKGPEYDRASTTVTAVAGETATVELDLTRRMDTADWIAADFHQHMEPSSDSTVRVDDRLLDNVGEGVELIVPTDHDVVTDLVPYIEELGLTDVVSTFPGAELSPSLAHTNVYPLPWAFDEPGRGTVPLAVLEEGEPRRRTVPELIAAARELPTDPVVQINHGRDSSGLFDLVEFDPEVGPGDIDSRWWTTDFDAMEIVNGDECLQMWDWAGLWNAGHTPTGIGSSDSHGLWGDAGSDRTYLYMPTVEPGAIIADDARNAVRDGQVVVAGDAFMRFTDGVLPGDLLTDTEVGPVGFSIEVQTPPWTSVDTITAVANGAVVETVDVTPASETLDFDGVVSVDVAEDFWVVFIASGPGNTYAFNNPVRVDRDGDGFTPPGVGPLEMGEIPFCD